MPLFLKSRLHGLFVRLRQLQRCTDRLEDLLRISTLQWRAQDPFTLVSLCEGQASQKQVGSLVNPPSQHQSDSKDSKHV